MPAAAIVVLLSLLSGALAVAGTYILAGLGAALLLSGVFLFAAGLFVRSGMRADGQ